MTARHESWVTEQLAETAPVKRKRLGSDIGSDNDADITYNLVSGSEHELRGRTRTRDSSPKSDEDSFSFSFHLSLQQQLVKRGA